MDKILVANWKMNPSTLPEAVELARASDHEGVILCPPFIYLHALRDEVMNAPLGAQDLFWEGETGPFTGEVSARMLKNLGVSHVIIGHSERRKRFHETTEILNHKLKVALAAGLTPIVCIGEELEEKTNGQSEAVWQKQCAEIFKDVQTNSLIYIAYEPVWAISTNKNALPDTPENAANAINFLQLVISSHSTPPVIPAEAGIFGVSPSSIKFLYGGSVNSSNAASFLDLPNVSGLLVGGASLKIPEWQKMMALI